MNKPKLSFDEWKARAIKRVREIEQKADVPNGQLEWILGLDWYMRMDGYDDPAFSNRPEAYADYQAECASEGE